ncbi:hypothetical protein D1815_22020 [Aquimarina sp. AD1]|uniref:tetratricopeptide repeat protein n=1 Tax=Aquimarina sp. (strain AD1) TaxID=1714848 RepID=UPI000E52200B|nr:tetratricopeptide repeat protein [Aquimarina sp. AD1]AXT58309.1 hypothetical protein D1815_22020 [Aquimarina sp. AD1]RKN03866.1 hypothetical protein D7035_22070 [Aquimarina sp. AD1]
MFKNFTSKKFELKILVVILIATFFIYINHFDNPFIFDDMHTVVNNDSIRTLDNWLVFFKDADTFSSLPGNRAYRPIITLMNAIDYNIAGKLDSNYYHYHIFLWFLVLIVLVFLLSKHIYKTSLTKNKFVGLTALFATAWFAFHAANAETINYICARSDSFSTLCIVASLILYINTTTRKWHLYLITMVIGIWTKQTGVMFFPILVSYVILFEEHEVLSPSKKNILTKLLKILKKTAPAGIIASSLFILNQYYLTPESTDSTNYFVTRFEYFSTQWYIITHYLSNFILPINLSADPDFTIIKPWYSYKTLFGLSIIIVMLFTMVKTALKKELRPISFGIAWFFIALLPTTLNPLFQIANDHRMFFPFIGLFIAVPYGLLKIIEKQKTIEKEKKQNIYIISIITLILLGHGYGTIQRNKVWNSIESIWLDVVVKSPKNGRGQMNYGLTQMQKGNYDIALNYFNKAYSLSPNYYVLHINLAILHAAKKDYSKAEEYFNSAIKLSTSSPSADYYYAKFLFDQKKYLKAEKHVKIALQKSPNHTLSKNLLNNISKNLTKIQEEISSLKNQTKNTKDPIKLLDLSLKYYQIKEYKLVITTCEKILQIDPKNAFAYNNICSAYNQLQKWKLGAEACQKAIKLSPNYSLAKNNLKWATSNLKKTNKE